MPIWLRRSKRLLRHLVVDLGASVIGHSDRSISHRFASEPLCGLHRSDRLCAYVAPFCPVKLYLLTTTQIHFYGKRHGTGGLQLRMHLAIVLYQLLVFCTAGLFCVLFLILYNYFGGENPKFTQELGAYLSGQTEKKPDGHYGLFFAYVHLCKGSLAHAIAAVLLSSPSSLCSSHWFSVRLCGATCCVVYVCLCVCVCV